VYRFYYANYPFLLKYDLLKNFNLFSMEDIINVNSCFLAFYIFNKIFINFMHSKMADKTLVSSLLYIALQGFKNSLFILSANAVIGENKLMLNHFKAA